MKLQQNHFRDALRDGRPQIGLWIGLPDANVAEAVAGVGFDWLLFDAEHAPNDLRTILEQLRAVAAYPVHCIVRPVEADPALVKQYLDIGAQTLLIPMIDTREQAELMVRAMRYPPEGIRGMGPALARASRWNQIEDYVNLANAQTCLLLQVETQQAMGHLTEIASVKGVDGVFFGPVDLSASMGLRGQPNHEDVQSAIVEGIAMVRSAGKAAGVLAADRDCARKYLSAGAKFVAVGSDATLLVKAARELVGAFKSENGPQPAQTTDAY